IDLVVNTGDGALKAVLSRDGKFLVASNRNAVDLWDVEKARRIRSFTGPKSFVLAIAISPDGRRVAAGTSEIGTSEIYIWDIETGQTVAKFDLGAASVGSVKSPTSVDDLAFTADGKRVIAAGSFGERYAQGRLTNEIARIIEISGGQPVRSIEIFDGRSVLSMDYSPTGKLFALGEDGGTTRIYDSEGNFIRSLASSFQVRV